MTVQPTTATFERRSFGRFRSALARLFDVLASASEAARCAREADRLFAKSDEELARMGLRRDMIVHHAFARYLHL